MLGVFYILFIFFGLQRNFNFPISSQDNFPVVRAMELSANTNPSIEPIIPSNLDESQVTDDSNQEYKQPILALPPAREGGEGKSIHVGGDSVQMDELGPMIITADGNIRRIANWNEMTKAEQAVAWRRIVKRNAERLEALRSAENSNIKDDSQQTNEQNEDTNQNSQTSTNGNEL